MTELKVANAELAVSQEGDEIFVQLPASGIDPAGGAKAAVLVDYGSVGALEFADAAERVAALGVAIPARITRGVNPTVRLGWTCASNVGDVRWGITYRYLGVGDVANAAGTEVLTTQTVNAVAHGYSFANVELGVLSETDRIIMIRVTRYGGDALDTTTGDAFLLGALVAFEKG